MTTTTPPPTRAPGISSGLALLFAIASGAAIGTLYLAQPLIETIARYFGTDAAQASTLVTVTQIGYAVGIFLLVPLGDVLNRRRLIPAVLTLSAFALLAAGLASSYGLLLSALAAVGLTAVAAQMLIPLASELADPARRGRTVGTVVSGALIGILLSRTVSGFIADVLGWRAVYAIVAGLALLLAAVLALAIPKLPARQPVPYLRLLGSVFTAVRRHRAVLPTLVITASNFAVFSLFWTALTFLLTAEPFTYSTTQIGLLGLVGLAGAIAGRRAGALQDRGWSIPATGVGLALLAVSLIGAWIFQTTIIGLIIVVVVLDVAVQLTIILGQTRLLALSASERSRLNTALVVANFTGGAVGSFLAGPLWQAGHWNSVMIGAGAVTLLAALTWLSGRRRLAQQS